MTSTSAVSLRTWLSLGLAAGLALGGCFRTRIELGGTSGSDDGGLGDGNTDVPDSATDHGADRGRDDGATETDDAALCTPGVLACRDATALICDPDGNGWSDHEACTGATPVCVAGLGCSACNPGEADCADTLHVRTCATDGRGWDTVACNPALGEHCAAGACTDLSDACLAARDDPSSLGCDFWATESINLLPPAALTTFRYAIVVANPQSDAAHVTVRNAAGVVASATVAAHDAAALELDWNEALRTPVPRGAIAPVSALVTRAAFRVRSDVPVAAFQFNPLRSWDGEAGSYSNDASLLLPADVLGRDYLVASRATFIARLRDDSGTSTMATPGFFAVVGTADGTAVTVHFTARTAARLGDGTIDAYGPGDTATFRLERFDVLQLLSAMPGDCTPVREEPDPVDPTTTDGYCDLGSDYDLTGTAVAATAPVAVFGGHMCAFVPFDRWAGDHLEEQLPPLEAWGERYVAVRAAPTVDEPSVWRVISGADGNRVTFTPEVHAPASLDRGAFLEFESRDDFVIDGTAPLLVVQFLGGGGGDQESIGDPSMALAVPADRYRTTYEFLAPDDFSDDAATGRRGASWISIVSPGAEPALLDRVMLDAPTAIPGTPFFVARVPVASGAHSIDCPHDCAVTSYGYGSYSSYMVPLGRAFGATGP